MRVKTSNKRREILLFPPSLEEVISEDNIVRLIDAFVDKLDLQSHGFEIKQKKKQEPGAPQYAPSDLLKIYIYGYLNRMRSSRILAKGCQINIEMMWLVNGLTPGHVTIANFRKDHPKALKEVFRTYNRFLNNQGLFGKETVAIDSAKIRAQNSKKNNLNDSSIKRHQEYIDKKAEEYLALLEKCDQSEGQEKSSQLKEKVAQLEQRKEKYNQLQEQLEQAKLKGEKQISTIDKDARLLTSKGSKGEVGYNLQSVVDSKHCLIVENELTNQTDQNALHKMAASAKELLEVDQIDALADTGYDTGEELMKCAQDNITTYVAPRKQGGSQKEAAFKKNNFTYNKQKDTYSCPSGEILTTNGKWYTKNRKGKKDSKFKEYKAAYEKCEACSFANQCAGARLKRQQGRVIERHEFSDYTEANRQRIKENKSYYRQRQAIVEHPFGTIKRQWGYDYTLLKGKEKVSGEMDLICLAYNMRRSVSILDVKTLLKALSELNPIFLALKWLYFKPFTSFQISKKYFLLSKIKTA